MFRGILRSNAHESASDVDGMTMEWTVVGQAEEGWNRCVCLRLRNCRKMTLDDIADMEKRQETLVFVCMCSVSWLLPVKLSVLAK